MLSILKFTVSHKFFCCVLVNIVFLLINCRLNVHLECQRVTNMSKEDIDWAFDLTKHNMQLL